MAKKPTEATISVESFTRMIHVIRGQRVMLDADLAKLYDVQTKVLNQAVSRNLERFPHDFAYQLTLEEVADLRSQIVTSKTGRGGRTYRPWVFTEHGIAMLSSVLRSEQAVRVNIQIIREFVRLRRLLATPGELATQLQQLADTVKLHDDQIKVITQILNKMLQPPPPPDPNRRIGFHAS